MGKRGLSEEPIPEGLYCYTPLGDMRVPEGGGIPSMPIKLCPYWHRGEDKYSAYCAYVDEHDDFVLWDQVKICGEKNDFDPEDFV